MDVNINRWKREYENMETPGNLDFIVNNAIKRGKIEMRRKRRRRGCFKALVTAAAVLVAFVAGINSSPTFANSVKHLPGGETIVKVLTFTEEGATGGEITDGQDIKNIEAEKQADGQGERLIVDLYQGAEPAAAAGHFTVIHDVYPHSIVVTLSGVRAFSAVDAFPDLTDMELFEDIYRLVTLDDSAHRFVVTFKKPVIVEISEQQNPAGIIIDVREDKEAKPLPAMYSLRTGSFPFGEEVGVAEGILKFELGSDDARILKDSAGLYFAEEGLYSTEEEAQTRAAELKAQERFNYDLHIEKREAGAVPKTIN